MSELIKTCDNCEYVSVSHYDPSPHGVSLSSGSMVDYGCGKEDELPDDYDFTGDCPLWEPINQHRVEADKLRNECAILSEVNAELELQLADLKRQNAELQAQCAAQELALTQLGSVSGNMSKKLEDLEQKAREVIEASDDILRRADAAGVDEYELGGFECLIKELEVLVNVQPKTAVICDCEKDCGDNCTKENLNCCLSCSIVKNCEDPCAGAVERLVVLTKDEVKSKDNISLKDLAYKFMSLPYVIRQNVLWRFELIDNTDSVNHAKLLTKIIDKAKERGCLEEFYLEIDRLRAEGDGR
jgi:hypothetical protein